jgi:hypothetical protein
VIRFDLLQAIIISHCFIGIKTARRREPFIDRDFLITFNGLLLLVLGISVFSIVERPEESHGQPIDNVNFALVVVTLAIDAIALSAILFRIASFGFTPNRVIVLGANPIITPVRPWLAARAS